MQSDILDRLKELLDLQQIIYNESICIETIIHRPCPAACLSSSPQPRLHLNKSGTKRNLSSQRSWLL
jgi:hypothetical protein